MTIVWRIRMTLFLYSFLESKAYRIVKQTVYTICGEKSLHIADCRLQHSSLDHLTIFDQIHAEVAQTCQS